MKREGMSLCPSCGKHYVGKDNPGGICFTCRQKESAAYRKAVHIRKRTPAPSIASGTTVQEPPSRHGEGIVVPEAPVGSGLGRLPEKINGVINGIH